MKLLVIENIKIGLHSIRSHMLRTVLTVFIIAFGIMSLVGIITAISSLEYYFTKSFAQMGANSFTIKNYESQMGGHRRSGSYRQTSFEEASRFKEDYQFPALTTISIYGSFTATVKYQNKKTNPNIALLGTDENYMITSGNELDKGRNFTPSEIQYGSAVAIVGSDVIDKLFTKKTNPVNQWITIGNTRYLIIGVMKPKGSSFGFSGDRSCILPLNNIRQIFPSSNPNYSITVQVKDPEMMNGAVEEATGLFRTIRKIAPGMPNNFEIEKSDNFARMLIENTKYISMAATIIGLITLFGAAIGLMNIMLVSVSERTREIGIRKSLGATKKVIRNQFLIEAVVIGQLGGILGIVLGILIGNIVSLLIGSSFVIPWEWIISGLALCFFVGLFSGLYPAIKAANLDPIESLRYE